MSALFAQIGSSISADTEPAMMSVYGGCLIDHALVMEKPGSRKEARLLWSLREVVANSVELCPMLTQSEDVLDRVVALAAFLGPQLLPEHEFLRGTANLISGSKLDLSSHEVDKRGVLPVIPEMRASVVEEAIVRSQAGTDSALIADAMHAFAA